MILAQYIGNEGKTQMRAELQIILGGLSGATGRADCARNY